MHNLINKTNHDLFVASLNYLNRQYSEKQIVGFSDDLKTVTYFDKMTYHYDYESSTGNLDEEMTFINAPLAVSLFTFCCFILIRILITYDLN